MISEQALGRRPALNGLQWPGSQRPDDPSDDDEACPPHFNDETSWEPADDEEALEDE